MGGKKEWESASYIKRQVCIIDWLYNLLNEFKYPLTHLKYQFYDKKNNLYKIVTRWSIVFNNLDFFFIYYRLVHFHLLVNLVASCQNNLGFFRFCNGGWRTICVVLAWVFPLLLGFRNKNIVSSFIFSPSTSCSV